MADEEELIPKSQVQITLTNGKVTDVNVIAPANIISEVTERAVRLAKTLYKDPFADWPEEKVSRLYKNVFGNRPTKTTPAAGQPRPAKAPKGVTP